MMPKTPIAVIALSIVAAGCGDSGTEGTVDTSGCRAGNMVGDVCAGVPSEPLCSDDVCTTGSCSDTLVITPAEVGQIAGAADGSCVVLRPGDYPAIVLPAGVSLFGKSADDVRVASVQSSGGSGVRIRGIAVTSGTLQVAGQQAEVDGVRVSQSPGDGIRVMAGGSVSISRSEIEGAARYGVTGTDAGSVDLDASLVTSATGPGMWLQCGSGCGCSGTLTSTISNVRISGSHLVGLSLVGVDATLSNLEVSGTTVGPNFEAGGGVSISGCSQAHGSGVRITDNDDFGMLVDDSSLDLDALEVSGNLRGVWIQYVGQSTSGSAVIRGATIADNDGVGLGVNGQSTTVSIESSTISGTRAFALPVLVGGVSAGAEEVGDGITWLHGSQVTLSGVTVTGSARASVLIDGEVASGSSIENVTLSGGDEAKGLIQQNLPPGGQQPTVSGTSPALNTSDTEQFSVPLDVAIPPSI